MELQFSKWALWDERESELSQLLSTPGIYALSISPNKSLSGEEFSLIEEIAYFGMTNSKAGLKGRLGQFNNSLRDKKGGGHGGAERFRRDYEDGDALAKILYVAVMSFECKVTQNPSPEDFLVMGDVAKAEYVAFARYLKEFQTLPKYNDKKASPKRKPS